MDIEKLIQDDIKQIQNKGARKQREISLRKYYDNPNFCTYCSKMIIPNLGQPIPEVKSKKFCNQSCSALYNNSKRESGIGGPKTFIELCSDDDFLNAYMNSTSYRELAKAIGYKGNVSTNVRKKIIEKINELGLDEYNKKSFGDITKKELISKRGNWQSWRSSIQRNARDVYNLSNKPKECAVCGYDNTYEVAHITPVSDFDESCTISEINSIDNLIALCPNHHWEYDNGYIKL